MQKSVYGTEAPNYSDPKKPDYAQVASEVISNDPVAMTRNVNQYA